MKQKAISLLLCAVLLMSVCVPGALGFRAWGEETEPPTFTTEEPTAPEETEPAPTDPEADPTEEAEPTEAPVCPICEQTDGHAEDCPEFVPEETETPFDPEEAKAIFLASGSLEEAEAFLAGLSQEQADALLAIVTEAEIHALLTNLGISLEEELVTPPRNYTRVGPLMPPVRVSPRLMMAPRTEEPENGLILSKNAEWIPGTDTYKITMEAYTTGKVISSQQSVPADIVLVLDESSSMTENLVEYTPVYELDQGKKYYVKWMGNNYLSVEWCEGQGHDPGWYSGPHVNNNHIGTRYVPMTSPSDSASGHVQFYEMSNIGSRRDALIRAAKGFVDKVHADAVTNDVDHRISVIGFGSSSTIEIGLRNDIRDNVDEVKGAIDALDANGTTHIEQGLNNAIEAFDSAAPASGDLRSRVVIVFTDGIPGTGTWTQYNINGSANPAIGYANTLKNQFGATVYSIGMVAGADPSLPISDAPTDSARTNKFLHYLSSNYPNAASMSSGGSGGGNRGYYLSASDTASLNDIFQKISQEIATPTISLGSQTQIRDIVSPYFTMPAGTEEIHLYTSDYDGTSFGARVPLTDATVTLVERTVTVTGFDFNVNFVSETPKENGTYGKKLIIEFVVSPTEGFLGGNGVPTNGADSAVYDKDGVLVERFPYPWVDVPLKGSFDCKNQSVYLSQTPDLEELLVETIIPDGTNNAFVNITYTLSDPTDGSLLAIKVIPAGQTGGAWVWEPGAEPNPLLTDDRFYTLGCEVTPVNNGTQERLTLESLAPWVYVYKPELTYRDSTAYYGDNAPADFPRNLTTTRWIHGTELASEALMGPPPDLTITYTPEENAIVDGKIAVKRDIPVKATVKIGEMDATAHTVFRHTPCDPACGWTEPTEKGDPAFLIHVALCQLTVTKNGGEAGETFIMDLYRNGVLYTQVTVAADSSVTIRELPVGTYSIRENASWAWRYDSTVSGDVTLDQSNPMGTVACTNKKGNEHWLSHSAAARNAYGAANQEEGGR